MSWIVSWQGRDYDVDPLTFSGLELSQIKLRTGLTFRQLLMEGIPDMDPDAIRALFWIVDRRTNFELNYGEYAGPPAEVWLPALPDFINAAGKLADGMGKATTPTTETNGTHSSPSTSPPPSTETSTTE